MHIVTGQLSSLLSRFSLRHALSIALSLALLVPSLIAGGTLIYFNTQQTLDVDSRERAENFANLLQAGLSTPMWNLAPETATPLVQSVFADASIIAIEVRDKDGHLFLDNHTQATPKRSQSVFTLERVISKDGEVLGKLQLDYSNAVAFERAQSASVLLLTVVFFQLLVSLWFARAWLSKRVIAPLESLRANADKITEGDLTTPVQVLEGKEFGTLTRQLDCMRTKLGQSMTNLEQRVQERTTDLQQANGNLQSTMHQLRQTQNQLVEVEKLASLGALVAGVAHELNTPIGTGVTVTTTLQEICLQFQQKLASGLRRSDIDQFIDKVMEGAKLAESSLTRAADLVRDFKKVAVDHTSARRRVFTLSELLEETLLTVRLRYEDSPVKIEVDSADNPEIDSFPGALIQVLNNLIDNAMVHAFTPGAGGKISIRTQLEPHSVLFVLEDNGIGISSDHLRKIFDPFFTTHLGHGGSGLGLSITRNLVLGLLGGDIQIDSEPGHGTRVNCRIALIAPLTSTQA
jgi:signal transduction histidine kinase